MTRGKYLSCLLQMFRKLIREGGGEAKVTKDEQETQRRYMSDGKQALKIARSETIASTLVMKSAALISLTVAAMFCRRGKG
jgi:hypothetical protein